MSWTFRASTNWYSSFGWIILKVWLTESSLMSKRSKERFYIKYYYYISTQIVKVKYNPPYEILRLIFLFVASLDRTSLSMEMVEMLSDLKCPSPLLK